MTEDSSEKPDREEEEEPRLEWPVSAALEVGLDYARNQLIDWDLDDDFVRLMDETKILVQGDDYGFARPADAKRWAEILLHSANCNDNQFRFQDRPAKKRGTSFCCPPLFCIF